MLVFFVNCVKNYHLMLMNVKIVFFYIVKVVAKMNVRIVGRKNLNPVVR